MEASEEMQRLGENAQEAFASGNPDTLRQDGGKMMEVMLFAQGHPVRFSGDNVIMHEPDVAGNDVLELCRKC